MTLNSGLGVIHGHWKVAPSVDHIRLFISREL